MKTWEKLFSVMDGEEFKHKLQETPDWQLHQQLMNVLKQKTAAQSPILPSGDMPCIMATCGAREWEQKCDKWAYDVSRISLLLIFFLKK